MTVTVDLRDQPEAELREQLFETLSKAGSRDEFEILAESDIDPHLMRYQIERDRALHWEYEHPDSEPRELQLTVGEPLDDATQGELDVRDLKPQRRHEVILEIFAELDPGEGFVLVNDHDPKPLYHELRSMHGDVIDWEYANRGSSEWRVEIIKTDETDGADEDIITRYDVREIPREERHPTIHHRYGMIPEGGTMEIVASHEPRPLRQEFRQRYRDTFSWEVIESEPGQCRVHITKRDSTAESEESPGSEESKTASSSVTEALEVLQELDVRDLPPAQRHERIFDAYDQLNAGEGFVLVNDHDPKPLYHQFAAETGPEFRWEYRLREPDEFKVLIGKAQPTIDNTAVEETERPF